MRRNKENGKMQKIRKKAGILLLILTLLSVGTVMSVQAKTAENAEKGMKSEIASAGRVTLKNTKGKNASDVAAIKKFLEQQKKQGNNVSKYEDLNWGAYFWSKDGKLIWFGGNDFKGKVSLKGFENIEHFYSGIIKGDGAVRELTVSDCPKLKKLECVNYNLRKLDISKCPELEELFCYDDNLKKLDVSKCPKLEYLSADENLNVSGWYFDINENVWKRE